jgi:hypothetical protein
MRNREKWKEDRNLKLNRIGKCKLNKKGKDMRKKIKNTMKNIFRIENQMKD